MDKLMQKIFLVAITASVLSGCASMRNGGAPEQAFDINSDLASLEKEFGATTAISSFYEAPSIDARNELIDGRLAIYNLRYIQFIRAMGADKQQLDAATDILLIGLGLAGTSTAAVRAKTNLAAVSTGVSGSKAIIDKNFYFEKTIPALIAAMNAQRKVVLLKILIGIREDLTAYPMTQAITDLQDYYSAGTLLGALDAIQSESSITQSKADNEIRTLEPVSEQAIEDRRRIRITIRALTESDYSKIQRVLISLDINSPPPANFTEAKKLLQRYIKGSLPDTKRNAIKNALTNADIPLIQ